MKKDENTKNFQVFVDDNFHYMDEDKRYLADGYETAEEAIAYCQKMVDDFLVRHYKPGMKADDLYDYYTSFGEDPFIRCNDPDMRSIFSAWDYANKRSIDMCAEIGITSTTDRILKAIGFAAEKHRNQRRKDEEALPYINHPIAVAALLTDTGLEYDIDVIQAAILHDTIEDTETTRDELEELFGKDVSGLVWEMTDDKSLLKAIRKQKQIEHAPFLSDRAKTLKISDKIANMRDVINNPPKGWSMERRLDYLDWAEKVVAAMDKVNHRLKMLFEEEILEGREKLNGN